MSEKNEQKILHLGEIGFPIAWEDWYAGVEKVCGLKIQAEAKTEFLAAKDNYADYLYIRINPSFGSKAFKVFPASNPMIQQIQYVDLFFRKNGVLWPHLLLKDTVHSLVVQNQSSVNHRGSVLIVGSGAEAIASCFALVEMGYRHLTLVIEESSQQRETLELLGKALFDVTVDTLDRENLIHLSGVYSLLLCFEDLVAQAELQTALLYFNYLIRGGLIINFRTSIQETAFYEEALAIRAKVLDLADVQVHQEIGALRKVTSLSEHATKTLYQLALS